MNKYIEYLENDGVIAFPTETVYELGALLNSKEGINKLYKFKKMPNNIPLSIYCKDLDQVRTVTNLSLNEFNVFKNLMMKFLPGPITILLKKADYIDSSICLNDKVLIRIPSCGSTEYLLNKINSPIVCTTANKYQYVCSTNENHVIKDLGHNEIKIMKKKKNDFQIGIESTIIDIDFKNNIINILRPGFITKNMIHSILNKSDFRIIEKYDELNFICRIKKGFTNKVKENTSVIDFGLEYLNDDNHYYTLSENNNNIDAMYNFYEIIRSADEDDNKDILINYKKSENQLNFVLYNIP